MLLLVSACPLACFSAVLQWGIYLLPLMSHSLCPMRVHQHLSHCQDPWPRQALEASALADNADHLPL